MRGLSPVVLRSRRRLVESGALLLAVLLTLLGATDSTTAQETSVKTPESVAHRLMDGMGGQKAFDAAPMIVFRFAVDRNGETVVNRFHAWDRQTGRYRLDMKTREGQDLRVLFNINDRKGTVWLGGALLDSTAARPHLDRAYSIFINDTYWLLMPWKWLDRGVHLAYEGTRDMGGHACDVVRLTFDAGIGLTSNDTYWGFVGPSGLLERWEFVLQDSVGKPGTEPPTAWTWKDWTDVGGGVRLAHVKEKMDGDGALVIWHPLIEFRPEVDEAIMAPPPPPAGAPPEGEPRAKG